MVDQNKERSLLEDLLILLLLIGFFPYSLIFLILLGLSGAK